MICCVASGSPSNARRWLFLIAAVLAALSLLIPLFFVLRGG
jgi:hypothetical protein